MDASPGFTNLSASEKKDVQDFLEGEMQKARFQGSVHSLTETCFRKCITSPIKAGALDKTESTCAQNCVSRFLDANDAVLGHLQRLQGGR